MRWMWRRWLTEKANAKVLAMYAVPWCVYVFNTWRFRQWLLDDALISVAYARTLVDSGKYAQSAVDAPIEGVSNPLWTLLLALLKVVGVLDAGQVYWGVADYVVVLRVIAVIAFVAIHVVVVRAAVAISPSWGRGAGTLGALLLGMAAPYVIWAASGLENPLYALLIAGLVGAVVRSIAKGQLCSCSSAWRIGVLAFLIAATRPDGLAFGVLYPIALIVGLRCARGHEDRTGEETRQRSWKDAGKTLGVYSLVAGLPTSAMLVARRVVFGLWVPHTAVAKSQRLDLDTIIKTADTIPSVLPWVWILPVCALTILLFFGAKRFRLVLVAGVTSVVLAAVVYCVLVPDWLTEFRFATPLVVTMAFMTAMVVVIAAQLCAPDGVRSCSIVSPASIGGVVAAGVVLALVQADMGGRIERFARRAPAPGCKVADAFGRTFNAYADAFGVEDGTVLLSDIGGSLLTSRLRVVDLVGLTHPTIGRLRGRDELHALRDYVLDEVKPTFLHIHGAFKHGFPEDRRFRSAYVLLDDNDNYVRKEVIGAQHDLEAIKQAGTRRKRAIYAKYEANPGSSCGPMLRGQHPLE